jgi:hypothetical protein
MHGGIAVAAAKSTKNERDVTVRAVIGPTSSQIPSVVSFQTFFWYVFASDFGPDSEIHSLHGW